MDGLPKLSHLSLSQTGEGADSLLSGSMTGSESDQSTDEVIAAVLADHADLIDCLHLAHAAAWRAVDPVLLELCRLRIATLLGSQQELRSRTGAAIDAGLQEAIIEDLAVWPTSERFGPRERACLAFAEQFIIDVASLDDDTAGDVATHLGPQGLIDFAHALLVVEQRQRLRLAWDRVLGPEPVSS